MYNPNNQDRKQDKGNEKSMKRAAFESKKGYSGSHNEKMKDQMNGMPMPSHVKNKDCY